MKKFLIINGPNLNLLGQREPEVYGQLSLDEINNYTKSRLQGHEVHVEFFQSNIEGEIITRIQQMLHEDWQALVINPGGYAHTSVAILDSLKVLKTPIIEVHLTNTSAREDFRQTKITARAASRVFEGLGKDAYWFAILSELIR